MMAAAAVLCLLTSASVMRGDQKTVYAFGVAASFNDSVVYFTDIRPIDSVSLDKNGFLPQREMYSYQLKNHVEYTLNKPDYTCMIYFGYNRQKLEKEASKVKAKYTKSTLKLQLIPADEFTFRKPDNE